MPYRIVHDEVNHTLSYTSRLEATEANGNDIDSHMILNADGTPLAQTSDAFTNQSKADTDVFEYTDVYRLVDSN